jgi:hypothetical protein
MAALITTTLEKGAFTQPVNDCYSTLQVGFIPQGETCAVRGAR